MTNTPQAAEPLMPCPFCGEPGETLNNHFDHYAACTKCFCAVGQSYSDDGSPDHKFRSEKSAAQAWNSRVTRLSDNAYAILREAIDNDKSVDEIFKILMDAPSRPEAASAVVGDDENPHQMLFAAADKLIAAEDAGGSDFLNAFSQLKEAFFLCETATAQRGEVDVEAIEKAVKDGIELANETFDSVDEPYLHTYMVEKVMEKIRAVRGGK